MGWLPGGMATARSFRTMHSLSRRTPTSSPSCTIMLRPMQSCYMVVSVGIRGMTCSYHRMMLCYYHRVQEGKCTHAHKKNTHTQKHSLLIFTECLGGVCSLLQGGWTPFCQIIHFYGTLEAADTSDQGHEANVRSLLGVSAKQQGHHESSQHARGADV